jgi:TRAP-type mannitol/chloroaromatic compound transport system permease small subunit
MGLCDGLVEWIGDLLTWLVLVLVCVVLYCAILCFGLWAMGDGERMKE